MSPADIKTQIPRYIELIASGKVQVPYRTYGLSQIAEAWPESARSGPRVVIVPD